MPRKTLEERFWAKVDRRGDGECWLWQGCLTCGYGTIGANGRSHRAHRVAYEMLVGPIPEGLQLDHLCRNPPCVNPAHLEPVTGRENVLRGVGITAQCARQTHCKYGHELTPENVYTPPNSRERACRTCRREYMHRYEQTRPPRHRKRPRKPRP